VKDDRPNTAVARTADHDLFEVAAAMRSISERLDHDEGHLGPLQRLVDVAVELMPGVRWASVSMLRRGRFTTAASTGEQAVRADVLQCEVVAGPCIDAVLRDVLYVSGDVSSDSRWSEWGRRANAEAGVRSVISQRLHAHDDTAVVAGLNLYSDARNAFGRSAVGVALVLATHGGLALSASLESRRSANLGSALQSNLDIGVAIGILMQQCRLTREEAFDVLRVASRNSNRKLAHLAADVVDTGTLAGGQLHPMRCPSPR
jgi:hypothetical protein